MTFQEETHQADVVSKLSPMTNDNRGHDTTKPATKHLGWSKRHYYILDSEFDRKSYKQKPGKRIRRSANQVPRSSGAGGLRAGFGSQ